jgi:hypothetical protein
MIRDGWVTWATRVPGVVDKVYTQLNSGHRGIVGHSIVGSYEGALSRLQGTQRNADGSYTAYAAASVMFILRYSGELVQMYPIWASTWSSGGREINCSTWAVELEGGGPGNEREPIRVAQVATLGRLCDEWSSHFGEPFTRSHFLEHGTVAAQFGYAPTACPSGRYGDFYDFKFPTGDEPMTPAERAEFDKLSAIVNRLDREGVVLGADGQGYNLVEDSRTQNRLIHEQNDRIAGLEAELAELRAADALAAGGAFRVKGEITLEANR